MMFEIDDVKNQAARIKVVGVGGAGGNAINNMISSSLQGVEFIAINTDMQVLETNLASLKVQIGESVTKGLGAGSEPLIGKQSALDDREAIADVLGGADMVFITAGMGGGTGTGASPVVADVARQLGALTVAIVTKPFRYEGKTRIHNAEEGVRELKENVDTIIVIPNDRIINVVDRGTQLLKGFSIANDVLRQAVQGISDIILKSGLINVDFADVRTIMQNRGKAIMGTGVGKGETGAADAAKRAILNPLLEDSSIEGARGILLNITGGINLSMGDFDEACSIIHEAAHDEARIINGIVIDPDIEDEVRATIIATGFEERKERIELKEVKRWRPTAESVVLRVSERILAKSTSGMVTHTPSTDLMPYEDPLDVPTFMRKIS